MFESGYYPAGAEFDIDAPYNLVDPEPREFEVEVSYSLYKRATVTSYSYEAEYDDESGYTDYTYTGDEQEDYEDSELTPLQMLNEYADMLTERLVDEFLRRNRNKRAIRYLQGRIQSTRDWDEQFEAV